MSKNQVTVSAASGTTMEATVQAIRGEGRSCEARSRNDLLFVFAVPKGADLRIGHVLEINPAMLDAPQIAKNRTTGQNIEIELTKDNVHDLRLPAGHGTSRFPSKERLGGA